MRRGCHALGTAERRRAPRHPPSGKRPCRPPVDLRLRLGNHEHTLVEPFENHIKTGVVFREIIAHIRANTGDVLPGTPYYELHVPIDFRLPNRKAERQKALSNLVDWLVAGARTTDERNSGPRLSRRSPYRSDDRIQGTPPHFLCEIELLRWPDATLMRRRPGFLGMKLVCPDGLEDRRRRRLDRAFSKKCPKLQQCKEDGARTVLVLESDDIALTSFDLIGNQLSAVLAERRDVPDDIFLVQTDTDPWWVWLMKQDDDHWPAVRMPEWNQRICDSDKLPARGMPEWYGAALQSDELLSGHSGEWAPATFDKRELIDLTSEVGA